MIGLDPNVLARYYVDVGCLPSSNKDLGVELYHENPVAANMCVRPLKQPLAKKNRTLPSLRGACESALLSKNQGRGDTGIAIVIARAFGHIDCLD